MTKYEYEAMKKILPVLQNAFDKVTLKVDKEDEKIGQKYITFKGDKCYTEDDIMAIYECDGCSLSECDKAINKLDEKLEQAESDKLKTLILEQNYWSRLLENAKYEIYEYENHDELINMLEEEVGGNEQ